jgi:K+-sensing histidine kinase KdpD
VLQADSLLLQRALSNLLENAVKYSPPQSLVSLEVGALEAEVQFSVKDQGLGIAPQDQAHLFELLYRGKSIGVDNGLGLDLAIVKRIIDAHGGHIWVESEVGRRETFFFTLPYLASYLKETLEGSIHLSQSTLIHSQAHRDWYQVLVAGQGHNCSPPTDRKPDSPPGK